MSIAGEYNQKSNSMNPLTLDVDGKGNIKNEKSPYQPTGKEKETLQLILRHFTLGYVNMYTPRVEFSDLAVIQRAMVDQMSFNTYQPNNGEGAWGDDLNNWRSRAVRPIVRNKCISIAAHATARLLFPKIFAWNENSDDQKDAAQVMLDLMEWAADQSDYTKTCLYNTLSALVNPAAIVYTEYAEVKRKVKRELQDDNTYKEEEIVDETLSGFKDIIVSPDELFLQNFFENDIQKQGWLVWRRVIPYDMACEIFGKEPNFEYVKPGIQTLYNDANQTFYQVYDPNMRQTMCEWVMYFNKQLDLKINVVNGVMCSRYDNPNPRNDKLHPFTWSGYEVINNRCAYFKSLAFKLMHDANIINTLYPMIIDGTYLSLFPPMVLAGEENVSSNVIVPGQATALSNPASTLTPIQLGTNLKSGFDALTGVEESINQSSEAPIEQNGAGPETAYEISVRENEKNTVLGLFVQMIGSFVKQYGRLRMGDILQYMTIGEVSEITDDAELVYKTFLVHDKKSESGTKHKKIVFDPSMPDQMTEKEQIKASFDVLGKSTDDTELWKANPELFRTYTYKQVVSPDVMNPLSENVERAYNLEVYDRAINSPVANQEEIFKLLLESTPTTKKDPSKFIMDQQNAMPMGMPGLPQLNSAQPMGVPPQQGIKQPAI